MDPINYGYFSWNSLRAKSVPRLCMRKKEKTSTTNIRNTFLETCDKRITIQDIQDCLSMNESPPKLREIEQTKELLGRRLPNELGDNPKQMISYMERPFAYTHAISLYVAQQRGCMLDQIDFLFSGNILGMLHRRKIDRNTVVLVQIKKGILIISKLASEMRNANSAGCKFERMICEEEYTPTSKLVDHSIIREVTIGNHRVLISTGIDCIDKYSNPIEAKFFEMKEPNDMYEQARTKNLLFQMISNGATEVVVGSKIFNEEQNSSKIINVQKYKREYVLDYVLKHSSKQNLLHKVIEGLNELKEKVLSEEIRAETNCYYRMTFKKCYTNEGERIMVIKPYDRSMIGTVEYCSQYLYDVLISNRGILRSLQDIKQYPNFYNSLVQQECRSCNCKDKLRKKCEESKLTDCFVPSLCFYNKAKTRSCI